MVPSRTACARIVVRSRAGRRRNRADGDKPPDIDAILPYIPDWDDFAGRFLRSGGAFIVATVDDAVAGCVGITPLDAERVRDESAVGAAAVPRVGLGRSLAVASMDEARTSASPA